MVLTLAALMIGIGLLAYAADQLVVGAARIAIVRNISPLLIGLVIVGFGTSLPELLVSTLAATGGDIEVAIGNIAGSNIANLSLLLGVGAMIVPISIDSATVRREVPLTVGAMVAFAVAVQGGINRFEGLVLLVAMAGALVWVSRRTGSDDDALAVDTEEFTDGASHSLGVELARTIGGLVGTVAGAQLLLWSALDLVDRTGLGGGFIGATLVALGTSLPELVTVVQSARRRETDLIVGNLLGSNLFNGLAVAGVAGLLGPGVVDNRALTLVAAGGAVLVALVAGAAMSTRYRVERWEGAGLILLYLCFIPLLAR